MAFAKVDGTGDGDASCGASGTTLQRIGLLVEHTFGNSAAVIRYGAELSSRRRRLPIACGIDVASYAGEVVEPAYDEAA
jgi:hypothetical protein